MSDRDDRRREEELLNMLRSELRDDHEPPADRIAEVRARAHEHRASAAAHREHRAPRRTFLLGGALAGAGAALGAAGFALVDDDPVAVPTEPITLAGLPDGVDASAELINHTWGVELLLTVAGLQDGRTYDVVYRATDGRDVPAGTFVGVGREMLCRMTGALVRDDTEAIEVRDAGGVVFRSRLA